MENISRSERVKLIEESRMRIDNYRKAITLSSCAMFRQHYEEAVVYEIDYILGLMKELYRDISTIHDRGAARQIKEFTIDELSGFDGTNGKPAYVAVNGVVYDVSKEPTWGGATHFGLLAGRDLTAQFIGCHGMEGVLSKLPQVGRLKKQTV